MNGSEIRARRLERRWSQAELGARVGVTQSMISQIESGHHAPGPRVAAQLQAILATEVPGKKAAGRRERERNSLPLEGAAQRELSRDHQLLISTASWLRPEQGGDGHALVPLQGDAWLVAAVDVAGHGKRLYPKLQYVLGWLRGFASAQASVPSVHSIAKQLEEELAASRIEAAWFLAVIQGVDKVSDEVLYSGISSSYPQPLLLEGAKARSVLSAGTWGTNTRGHRLSQVALEPPWTLLICSDGLLARFGGGEESTGLHKLRRWLRGAMRERPLAETMQTEQALVDDESALLIKSRGGRTEVTFDVGDEAERHRAIRWIERLARNPLGDLRAPYVGQAVLEALTNARDHAYGGAGLVVLRALVGISSLVVEVRDQGRGHLRGASIRESSRGFRIMRGFVRRVDAWKNHPKGTVVALSFDREPDNEE